MHVVRRPRSTTSTSSTARSATRSSLTSSRPAPCSSTPRSWRIGSSTRTSTPTFAFATASCATTASRRWCPDVSWTLTTTCTTWTFSRRIWSDSCRSSRAASFHRTCSTESDAPKWSVSLLNTYVTSDNGPVKISDYRIRMYEYVVQDSDVIST